MIGDFISHIKSEIEQIIDANLRIIQYYESQDFLKIKETCEALMNSQREFNEYIKEKVNSISKLFGTSVVRTETVNDDKYNYIRPYKKTITPFTAEVSKTVFESAENNPLEYVVKKFYPNRVAYPEQIRKLYHLVEELETLRDAKQIIENYKMEYQQYLGGVPDYIMRDDEAGFYSRLGFADIDEDTLTVEYQAADDGSANSTYAAGHAGAAQDHSGNGIHFCAVAYIRLAGIGAGAGQDTCHGGHKAGNYKNQENNFLDIDAGVFSGLLVVAYGIDVAPKLGLIKNDTAESYRKDDKQELDGQLTDEPAFAQEGIQRIIHQDSLGMGVYTDQASADVHGS